MAFNLFPTSSKSPDFSESPAISEAPITLDTAIFSQMPVMSETATFSRAPTSSKTPAFLETPAFPPIEGSFDPSAGDPRAEFLEAARNGSENEMQALLRRKSTLNETSDIDHALREASAKGRGNMVKILLGAGAKIESRSSENGGRTALQAAAENGHTEVVSILLKAGADVRAKALGYRGRTALQAAAGGGHTDLVSILLNAGANVNAKPAEYSGRTALQAAAGRGHAEVVSILLKAGANVNAKPSKYTGRTALQAAAGGGHAEIVSVLLESGVHLGAEPCEHFGKTALQAAVEGEHIEVVTMLLEASATDDPGQCPTRTRDIDAPFSEPSSVTTPLLVAVERGNVIIVDQLIQKGADVNFQQKRSDVLIGPALPTWPLLVAAEKGHTDVVRILLNCGADPNMGFPDMTAIRAAAEAGHLDVVELLLGTGLDINAYDKRGRTCLVWAISYPEIIQVLLKKGADMSIRDVDGSTLLHMAAEGGNTDVVQILLDKGLDINDRNKYGVTCLSRGIPRPEMIRFLLDKGADVEVQDMDGATPLHHAVRAKHTKSIVTFLDAGTSIESEDYDHRKPLDIVLHELGSSPESKEVLNLLLRYGCDTRGRDMKSWCDVLGAKPGDVIKITEAQALSPVASSLSELDPEVGEDGGDRSSAMTQGSGDNVSPLRGPSLEEVGRSESDLSGSVVQDLGKPRINVNLIKALLDPPPIHVPGSPDSPRSRELYSGLGADIFFPAVKVGEARFRFPKSKNSTSAAHATAEWQWLLLDQIGASSGYGLSNIRKLYTAIDKQALLNCYACFQVYSVDDTSSTGKAAGANGNTFDRTHKLKKSEISWTMRKPRVDVKVHGTDSHPIFYTEDFRSTLNIGWIPGSGIEFFTMFISDLHKKWNTLLEEIHDHLDKNFDKVLRHKGETSSFIEHLLYDARLWGKMQALLRSQVSTAMRLHKDFTTVRHLRSELGSKGGKEAMRKLFSEIRAMEEDVGSEFQKIAQATKDMIQFELNLVSVHEARLSEKLGLSMKRLSWITFFFLPLMFVASVFGMNIDLINGVGPHWTWVIGLSGSVFALVVFVWAFMKLTSIDKWFEDHRGKVSAEWKGISGGLEHGWQKLRGIRHRGDLESGNGYEFKVLSRELSDLKYHN